MSKKTNEYQALLKKEGFYSGKVDGAFGPLTAKASVDYQTSLIRNKGGANKNYDPPAWLLWAIGELGVKELPNDAEHPRIIYYHGFTNLGARKDEIAWCASFVNAALNAGAGYKGTKSAAAASFKTYGKSVLPTVLGAILLKATNTGSKRHVFFNIGTHDNIIFGLGGNQSNSVNVMEYTSSQITESRYPVLS